LLGRIDGEVSAVGRAFVVFCLCASLGSAAALAAGSRTSGASSCQPGAKTVSGAIETTYCGSAKATLHAGATDTFSQGQCFTQAQNLTVNIGTTVVATNASALSKLPKLPYFGLDVGRSAALTTAKPAPRDGTYQGGLLVVNYNGANYFVSGTLTVTLTHNRTAGSFSGTTGKGQHLSGTFSC
jgi:hypothetical protein